MPLSLLFWFGVGYFLGLTFIGLAEIGSALSHLAQEKRKRSWFITGDALKTVARRMPSLQNKLDAQPTITGAFVTTSSSYLGSCDYLETITSDVRADLEHECYFKDYDDDTLYHNDYV